MNPDEAYQSLLGLILAPEPTSQDGLTWDRIALTFTTSPPDQTQISYLSEAASSQLLGALTDALCRMFLLGPNNIAYLTTGLFQGNAAAIAGLPRRVVELRALGGAGFCEGVRRMVEERGVVGDAALGWGCCWGEGEMGLVERGGGLGGDWERDM